MTDTPKEVVDQDGPPGPDRRWKLAAEMVMGTEFKTPRELINALATLKARNAELTEQLSDAQANLKDEAEAITRLTLQLQAAREVADGALKTAEAYADSLVGAQLFPQGIRRILAALQPAKAGGSDG